MVAVAILWWSLGWLLAQKEESIGKDEDGEENTGEQEQDIGEEEVARQ